MVMMSFPRNLSKRNLVIGYLPSGTPCLDSSITFFFFFQIFEIIKIAFFISYLEHKTMADTPKSWSLDLDVLWTFK